MIKAKKINNKKKKKKKRTEKKQLARAVKIWLS